MNETTPNAEHIKSLLISAKENIDELLSWSDDIPSEILDGTVANKKFKVRKNWFQGIIGLTGFCKMIGILSSEELEIINKFDVECSSENFKHSLTTTEDIKKGNEVLEILKNSIENFLANN